MKQNKLSKIFLEEEYSYYKKQAFDLFHKDRLNECLSCIKHCGTIAWAYPILFNFCDDELEDLMNKIKRKFGLFPEYNKSQDEKKVILYNSKIIDSGALTEQYLNYLIEKNYQILFIIPDEKNTKSGQNILRTITENENIELYIASSINDLNRIKEIDAVIKKFGAVTAFLHFDPNDIVGYTVFSDLTFLKRYYIVHNDHTFWFGKGCSDFFLEFRKFGCNLAVQRRLIDYNKIFQLPYYPIIQKKEFQGFPFDPKGKTIGFSGANLYKYYLDPELSYFKAIKELIIENNDFIFCLAGFGDASIVNKFIIDNELQDRFFFLGKRSDFYSVVSHIDILFESYPMKGGLTVLYAVENQKAITGIGNIKTISLPIEDFFDLDHYKQAQNFDDFKIEADLLIKDKKYRLENAMMFKTSKFKKSFFTETLSKILDGDIESKYELFQEKIMLDNDYYLGEYLSLPDSVFNFYYYKLLYLNKYLSFMERILISIRLMRLKPKGIKKRLIRYLNIRSK